MQSFESLQPHFNLEGVIYTEKIGIYSIVVTEQWQNIILPSCTKLDQEFSLIANNYKLPKSKVFAPLY
jgi:hypothetical protein